MLIYSNHEVILNLSCPKNSDSSSHLIQIKLTDLQIERQTLGWARFTNVQSSISFIYNLKLWSAAELLLKYRTELFM